MIIDAHAHIGHWKTLKESENNILESQEKYGISYSLISNADAGEFPCLDKFGKQYFADSLTALKKALGFARKYPSRIGVLFWIRPAKERLTPEIVSFLKKHKAEIHGLKFHPFASRLGITSYKVNEYLELAKDFNWPILVHTAKDEYSDISYLKRAAKKYPEITFIAAHANLCTDNKQSVYKTLKDCPNVLIDTAWVKVKVALKIIHDFGPMRVIFGTDNPIDGMDTLANKIYLPYLKKDPRFNSDEWDLIMYQNAKRIYDI